MANTEECLRRLEKQVAYLSSDLKVLRTLVEHDYASALNKIRYITEKVLHKLCKGNDVSWGKGEPTVENMIGPLIARSVIPKNVSIHIRTIQTNASPGSHYQEDSLSSTHVNVSKMALLDFLEWYCQLGDVPSTSMEVSADSPENTETYHDEALGFAAQFKYYSDDDEKLALKHFAQFELPYLTEFSGNSIKLPDEIVVPLGLVSGSIVFLAGYRQPVRIKSESVLVPELVVTSIDPESWEHLYRLNTEMIGDEPGVWAALIRILSENNINVLMSQTCARHGISGTTSAIIDLREYKPKGERRSVALENVIRKTKKLHSHITRLQIEKIEFIEYLDENKVGIPPKDRYIAIKVNTLTLPVSVIKELLGRDSIDGQPAVMVADFMRSQLSITFPQQRNLVEIEFHVKDKSGVLAEITEFLSEKNINIISITTIELEYRVEQSITMVADIKDAVQPYNDFDALTKQLKEEMKKFESVLSMSEPVRIGK